MYLGIPMAATLNVTTLLPHPAQLLSDILGATWTRLLGILAAINNRIAGPVYNWVLQKFIHVFTVKI